jgi:hypothetical protein|tara:strand:- start:704 stop:1216 length:513 start_codon:yes stop_codon:yes gene_type:complete
MSYNASPTFFDDLFAATLRQLETGIATVDWETGGNAGASNAHGLGINIGGGELPAIPTIPVNGIGMNWTLTDQFSVARIPQVSQVIGGFGQVVRTGNVATTWDATQPLYTTAGAASSGGVSGNGQVASPQTINTATNQANEADGTPAYNAYPTTDGEATLTTLDPGWVSG